MYFNPLTNRGSVTGDWGTGQMLEYGGRYSTKAIARIDYRAIDPAGAGQIGTVYSVQGFETQHVGVIVGPDLGNVNGHWVARPERNFSNSLRGREPAVALPYIKRIYRTLMSRGMRSCSVYCTDGGARTAFEELLL